MSAGSHVWKLGGGVQILPTYMVNPGNPIGTWTFRTDQYLQPGRPGVQLQPLQPDSSSRPRCRRSIRENLSHTFEAYVQDEWRPPSNLTLNLGLRYDLQTKIWNEDFDQSRYPRPLPLVDFASRGDDNNVAPRAGVAWDLRGDGRSVVRGGYGLVYGNVQNSLLDGEINAFQQYTVTIRNPSYPDPYQGRDPLSFVSTAPPNITDRRQRSAQRRVAHRQRRLVAGAGRARSALHVDGIYTRIDDFPDRVNINTPGSGDGPAAAARLGPHRAAAAVVGTTTTRRCWCGSRSASRTATSTPSRTRWRSRTTLDRNERQRLRQHHRRLQPGSIRDRPTPIGATALAASGAVLLPLDITLGRRLDAALVAAVQRAGGP